MKNGTFRNVILATSLALGFCLSAAAQGGTGEIAAGGGMGSFYGNGSTSTKGKVTASIAWNAADDFAFAFEYGYAPLTLSTTGTSVTSSANIQFIGGVARVSILHEHRARPYFLFTGGGAAYTASASATSSGTTTTATASERGEFIGFGGGVNLRLGGHFGIRPEARYQRVDISGALNEVDLTASLYYSFGGNRRK